VIGATTATLLVTAVPLPAGIWLLVGALASMGCTRRVALAGKGNKWA